MSPFDLLAHLLSFAAPALALAVGLALSSRVLMRQDPQAPALWMQVLINFLIGLLVLIAGLVIDGRDGRLGSYAALVVVSAGVQWGLIRGWRA